MLCERERDGAYRDSHSSALAYIFMLTDIFSLSTSLDFCCVCCAATECVWMSNRIFVDTLCSSLFDDILMKSARLAANEIRNLCLNYPDDVDDPAGSKCG